MSEKENIQVEGDGKPESGEAVEADMVASADAESVAEAVDQQALTSLLEDARSKADEHWEQCIRLQAELENLRKRGERDISNARKFALERFSQELLPVRDSLEMGISAADGENIDPAKLKEGTELTLKMLTAAMEKFGIREINPQDQRFDPEYHQAMSMQPRQDVEPNTVVTVVQKGYLLNDRLIRPAMVIVSREADPTKAEGRA
jgi:molecular chaperone GrpE